MKNLLTFDEQEEKTTVEEAFGLTFQVALTDALGSRLAFDLKKNGDTILVTKDNREVIEQLLGFFSSNFDRSLP